MRAHRYKSVAVAIPSIDQSPSNPTICDARDIRNVGWNLKVFQFRSTFNIRVLTNNETRRTRWIITCDIKWRKMYISQNSPANLPRYGVQICGNKFTRRAWSNSLGCFLLSWLNADYSALSVLRLLFRVKCHSFLLHSRFSSSISWMFIFLCRTRSRIDSATSSV